MNLTALGYVEILMKILKVYSKVFLSLLQRESYMGYVSGVCNTDSEIGCSVRSVRFPLKVIRFNYVASNMSLSDPFS